MKEICQKIIGILLIVVMITFQNISFAVTQAEINDKKKEQEQIEQQEKEAEARMKEVEAKKSQTMKQVESLASQINQYESEIDKLDSQIAEANTKINEQETKLKQAQEDYTEQKDKLQRRIVAVYEAGETKYLDLLLGSESLTEFISNYYILSEVAEHDKELLKQIDIRKKEIETAKKELENSKKELTTAKSSKEAVSNQLKTSKAQKDSYVAQLSEEEKKLEKELAELQAENKKIANEIKLAEQKYAEQLNKLQNNNNSSSISAFVAPVKTGYISARAYYSSGKFHGALDYAVSVGTPIYAVATGVVMSTANLSGSYGTYIVIRHANGLQTYYAHGKYGSICVSPGQTVSQGQKIMLSGNTGNSAGPHLHFEVRKSPYNYNSYAKAYGQDSRVNPLNYL